MVLEKLNVSQLRLARRRAEHFNDFSSSRTDVNLPGAFGSDHLSAADNSRYNTDADEPSRKHFSFIGAQRP
jgi:hypothetical protein